MAGSIEETGKNPRWIRITSNWMLDTTNGKVYRVYKDDENRLLFMYAFTAGKGTPKSMMKVPAGIIRKAQLYMENEQEAKESGDKE